MSYLPEITITFKDNDVYKVKYRNLVSFTCSENMMDSDLKLNPGICEQYANISICDKDNYLHEKALNSDIDEAFISIVLKKGNNIINLGNFYSSEWIINVNSEIVKLNGRDKTYLLNNINVPRVGVEDRTVHTLLVNMFQYAGLSYQGGWNYYDNDTKIRCENILVKDSWYRESNLKTLLDKICVVGMLRIFCKNDVFYVGRCM